ncbi:cytochrome c3 family protein [Shewanella baltica]|uniref:cytochrome c3 family protein n=1 Tax=Shewanella baltica TaxID=62322 RepID=UPI003D03D056
MMKYFKMRHLLLTFAIVVFANGTAAAELGNTHKNAGIGCADCHGKGKPKEAAPMFACLQCHDTKELADTTKDIEPTNPHKNRHNGTETNCNTCHHQHKPSENACLGCHERWEFKKMP